MSVLVNMEKKRSSKRVVSLGGVVHKKKRIKKPNKKTFLNFLRDYLKSDGYMFAPLFSALPFGLQAPKIGSFFDSVEVVEPSNVKGKRLLEKAEDYLKSDSYMYGPLVAPRRFDSPDKGPSEYVKMATTEISVRTTVKSNPANVIAMDTPSESTLLDTGGKGRKTPGYKKTVKRTVYQTCRSSSVSGKRMLNSQLNKLL